MIQIGTLERHFVKHKLNVTLRRKKTLFVTNNKLEWLNKNENSRKFLSITVTLMEVRR